MENVYWFQKKRGNNDCVPRASEPILHGRVLQQLQSSLPINSTFLHSSQSNKENVTISSDVQLGSASSTKCKETRMQLVPAETTAVKESTLLQILNKLSDIQKEQQQTNNKIIDFEKQMRLMRVEFDLIADRVASRAGIVRASSFDCEPVSNNAKLDCLEQKLNEAEFVQRMQEFLQDRHPADTV